MTNHHLESEINRLKTDIEGMSEMAWEYRREGNYSRYVWLTEDEIPKAEKQLKALKAEIEKEAA